MIGRKFLNRGPWAGIAFLAFFALACSDATGPTSTSQDDPVRQEFGISLNTSDDDGPPQVVTLCKTGPEGTTADFAVGQDPEAGTLLQGSELTLDATSLEDVPDGCVEVWKAAEPKLDPDPTVTVTITETGSSGGAELDRIVALGGLDGDKEITDPVDPTITVDVNFNTGAIVFFKNVEAESGGEGCTPGFWRQEHHFGFWPDQFQPDDVFSDVFGTGFDITLAEATRLKGGQENALGRHAVAALLNAASDEVSYDMSVQEVVDAVRQAFETGEFEATKDELVGLNEQGCPLGEEDDEVDDVGAGGAPGHAGPPGRM